MIQFERAQEMAIQYLQRIESEIRMANIERQTLKNPRMPLLDEKEYVSP